jgi:AcrR family transcriptional regulator
MLNMRTGSDGGVAEGDLTARARLRGAAISLFAEKGFGVSMREIANEVGVSPGLVVHHFASKQGLRDACDAAVLERIRTVKAESVSPERQSLLAYLSSAQDYAPVLGYVVRSLQSGGSAARAFFEHFVADAEQWLNAGVEAGTLRPSRDPAARARYLAQQSLGGMLLHVALQDDRDSYDFHATVRELTDANALPALELFTEGLMADRRMLDEYLMYVTDPPGSTTRPQP